MACSLQTSCPVLQHFRKALHIIWTALASDAVTGCSFNSSLAICMNDGQNTADSLADRLLCLHFPVSIA